MADKDYDSRQQELFDSEAYPQTARRTSPSKREDKNEDFYDYAQQFSIRLSYESVFFIAIGLIVMIVAAFVLGMERGQKSVIKFRKENIQVVPLNELKISTHLGEENETRGEESQKHSFQVTVEPAAIPKGALGDELAPSEFYSIQVASFKSEAVAQAERDRLLRSDVAAYVLKSRSQTSGMMWYKIYAGKFDTAREAEAEKPSMIKKGYKDCLVRKVSASHYQNAIVRE